MTDTLKRPVGRPRAREARATVTIMSSDEMILRDYPHANLGMIRARQAARKTLAECNAMLGIDQHYSKMERGMCRVSLEQAFALADFFGVSVEQFRKPNQS
jgi:hypothetical protein